MKTQNSITVPVGDLAMTPHNVGFMNVNGGRFVEIAYGLTGEMSVMIDRDADPVAALFAHADSEFEHARSIMRRAMTVRLAAWKLSRERTALKQAV